MPSGSDRDAANRQEFLLVVALKTDQPNIERRVRTILAAAEPFDSFWRTVNGVETWTLLLRREVVAE